MRQTLSYFVAVCIFLATLADIGVWWNSRNIKIFDEEEDSPEEVDDTVTVEMEDNAKIK